MSFQALFNPRGVAVAGSVAPVRLIRAGQQSSREIDVLMNYAC